MAEEFVSQAQFGEFVKRMEERFDHAHELAEQRYESVSRWLADADKAREQNLIHVNQRFDDMNRRMGQGFENLEKRLDFQSRMTLAVTITVGGGILVGLVKYLFFPG